MAVCDFILRRYPKKEKIHAKGTETITAKTNVLQNTLSLLYKLVFFAFSVGAYPSFQYDIIFSSGSQIYFELGHTYYSIQTLSLQ